LNIIDPNFTGAVIKSFSDALQTSLAFKTKLVSRDCIISFGAFKFGAKKARKNLYF
jgi:hypothetical protein